MHCFFSGAVVEQHGAFPLLEIRAEYAAGFIFQLVVCADVDFYLFTGAEDAVLIVKKFSE